MWGIDVPASGKVTFLPYSFKAKLGIDGKGVKIAKAGEKSFRVTVPRFIFIGHDELHFEDMVEAGEPLSGTAQKINQSKITNQILSPENESKYVSQYSDVLEQQTKAYYTNLVTSIDPNVTLEFEFEK